jgi:hypothetical protein
MKKSQRTLETCTSQERRKLKLVMPVATQDKPMVTMASAVHTMFWRVGPAEAFLSSGEADRSFLFLVWW